MDQQEVRQREHQNDGRYEVGDHIPPAAPWWLLELPHPADRLFLGLARHQKAARTCLARAAQVAPNGKCYADGGECFLL